MNRRVPADFAPIVQQMIDRHDLRIVRWRKSMSGCAWRVHHLDGSADNFIEAPYPRTPISLAIFLHEVGHHVIGFQRYKKRCEEEYYAWMWAVETMIGVGIEPDARVRKRVELSMRYAIGKAIRRGIRELPATLERFLPEAA